MSVTVPDLSSEQVDAVLQEALHRRFFETDTDGNLPTDSAARKEAASELIRQSLMSYSVGNKSDGVQALLHIAEVQPGIITNHTGDDVPMATAEQDLTKLPDAMLTKVQGALQNYDQTDEVASQLQMVNDEIARRNGGAVPAPASVPEALVEAAAPSEEELARRDALVAAAAASAPAVDRSALENQLTFPIMRAHGIDPSEIPSITDSQLQWIIEHPTGNGVSPQIADPAPPPAVPVEQQGEEVIQTTRMVVQQPEATTPPPSPAPAPEPEPAADNTAGITAGRVALEEQITGPILKVYGRGRKDVPEIGDSELEFMILHPNGKVTKEALEAARALDQGESVDPSVFEANDEPQTIADQNRAEKQPAPPAPATETAVDGFAPPTTEEPPAAPASMEEAVKVALAPGIPPKRTLLTDLPENPAQEIIDREGFPVASELEGTPRLPFDLSKESDESIRSYHSRFHAVHARMNVVVALWESELSDEVRLRKGREVAVMNALPIKDGRTKLTDAQREAMVQADPEVISHREREHELTKLLRQLKTLQSNYSTDVSVCSRQLGRREEEREGAR